MANNIEFYRKKAGLTQRQFSEACGWGKKQGRISNYEQGVRTPSIDDMRAMVRTLVEAGVDCTLDQLFPPCDKKESAA